MNDAQTAAGLLSEDGTRDLLRRLGYPEGAIRQAIEHAGYTRPEDGPVFLGSHSVIRPLDADGYRVIGHKPQFRENLRELEIGRDPGGNTDFGQYIGQAIRAAEDGTRDLLRRLGYPEGAIRQAIEHAGYTRPEDGPVFLGSHSVIRPLDADGYRVIGHKPQFRENLRELEIGRDPGGNTDFGQYIGQAIRAAEDGHQIRLTRHGKPVAVIMPPAREDGPDLLIVTVRADSLPGLRDAALREARDLYGKNAELRIERSGPVRNSSAGEGRWRADITVRCMNYPQEAAL